MSSPADDDTSVEAPPGRFALAVRWAGPVIAVVLIVGAVWVLWDMATKMSFADIRNAALALPAHRFVLAFDPEKQAEKTQPQHGPEAHKGVDRCDSEQEQNHHAQVQQPQRHDRGRQQFIEGKIGDDLDGGQNFYAGHDEQHGGAAPQA